MDEFLGESGRGSIFLIIIIVLSLVVELLGPILTYGDLDSLTGKCLAQRSGFDDAWEFLGRIDLEGFGEASREDRSAASVQGIAAHAASNIDEAHLQPERALGPHGKILENKPETDFALGIGQAEGIHRETSNEVPSEHTGGRWLRGGNGHGRGHLIGRWSVMVGLSWVWRWLIVVGRHLRLAILGRVLLEWGRQGAAV